MNWLSGALMVLGAGVVLGGLIFALSKFIGVRGRVVAEHRRVWYVDFLARLVLNRDGVPGCYGGGRQIPYFVTCCCNTFDSWRAASVTTWSKLRRRSVWLADT